MMATEATPGNLATPSTISDHDLNAPETSSQDVSSEQPLVNGTATTNTENNDAKQEPDNAEAIINSAEVSVSGGSDTEASKTETTKNQADEKGHVRTTSTVKKPTSFKAVSVNKTFLAAKGATAAAPSKLGEKGTTSSPTASATTSASSTPRPRLVAKSGSGLRDSAPRASAAANGNKAGAAPDASAVWNKNRPAPPPEPKRFTDEELKQRYGIHLATRLHTDESGKEKNWADIDDDDDDWAPDSIEWTDGTKITLPQADEVPAAPTPEPIPAPVAALKETKPADIPKSKSPVPAQRAASPSVKTGLGTGRAGLVLKGASEKPTLVAKPPGPPTPVKSPWATLPPVDKVAPVAIEIPQPQQAQQSRFNQRDPHGFSAMPPPTKEIAADDFSRTSWRDSNAPTSRELYNSQSGRYEPVNDNRRGANRSGEAHSRQPAVLQRPSQDGPAEPSAAFQTHRASGQDGAYGRRRTSSNVSGGSGNFVRRMSRGGHEMPPPHDMLNVRRGSLAAVSDAPSSPRNFSPSGQQTQRGHPNQPWPSHASPIASHPSPQSTQGQPMAPGSTDDQGAPPAAILTEEQIFEQQKKRMKERREEAVKRRQEEEAREEAARKERIRIKLEAMGPPPETKKNKKDTPKEDKVAPTIIKARDEPDSLSTTSKPEEAKKPAESQVNAPASVHDSSAASTESKAAEKLAPSHRPNGVEQGEQGQSAPAAPQPAGYQSKASQPWHSNSVANSDRYSTWAPPTAQQSTGNVWGPPPTNNKALGNGAFNPELGRVPDMHPARPSPIGPPNSSRGNYQFSQGRGGEYGRARQAPIGPPNRSQDPNLEADRRAAQASPWSNAHAIIEGNDNAYRDKTEREAAQRRELEERGEAPEIVQPIFNDRWVETGIQNGSRVMTGKVHKNVLDGSGNAPDEEQSHRQQFDTVGNGPQHQFSDTWRSANGISGPSQAPRGSRFFPAQDVRLEEQSTPFDRPGSPTPPPPTMIGHPAYDGDIQHPNVLFPPPEKPSVVVRLPPAVLAPIGPPRPASFAAAVTAPAVPHINSTPRPVGRPENAASGTPNSQDVRRAPESSARGWQDRIDMLTGRSPRSHAYAVDSSSKNALELPQSQLAATVSLPSLSGTSTLYNDPFISKPPAEECFEEQEMGSLPVIKVPVQAPPAAWALAPHPKPLPKKFLASQVTTAEPLAFPEQVMNNRIIVHVKLNPDDETQICSMAARQRSNPRRGSSRGGTSRHPSSTHPRGGGRGRDTSSAFQSPSSENGASSSSPRASGRGSHRGRGHRSNNWDTHVSTPIHT